MLGPRCVRWSGAALVAALLLGGWARSVEAAFWLPPDLASNDPRVAVAIGDSITVGIHNHVIVARPYPAVLQGLLAQTFQGYAVLNRGVGGETTDGGLQRLLQVLIADRPTFVLIMEGTNDAIHGADPDVVVANLRAMVRLVKARYAIPILGAIPPNFRDDADVQAVIAAVNARLPGVAAQEGVRFVDIFAAMNDEGLFSPEDLVHPSQHGYDVLGAAWLAATSDAVRASRSLVGGVSVAGGHIGGAASDQQIVAGAAFSVAPRVRTFRTNNLPFGPTVLAYANRFLGGVRVAACDVDGDGRVDLVTGAGPGGGPHVKVTRLDATGAPIGVLASFLAFSRDFTGGVFVACGDLDGNGRPEIIVGAGRGGAPQVRAFRYDPAAPGGVVALPVSFFPFSPRFPGGVTVAVGDLDGDGSGEIIIGAGAGGFPSVRTFRYKPTAPGGVEDFGLTFLAFNPLFKGGVRVAAGDLDGDGQAEVVVGTGPGSTPRVRVFRREASGSLTPLGDFFAYRSTFRGGVFVAVAGGRVLTGAGPGGGAHVRGFTATGAPTGTSFIAWPN